MRPLRSIQPKVDAGREKFTQRPVVVLKVNNTDIILNAACQIEDPADESLSRLVAGVSLPGVDDLKGAAAFSYSLEPLRIGEQEVRPLVSRGPAREAYGKNGAIQGDPVRRPTSSINSRLALR